MAGMYGTVNYGTAPPAPRLDIDAPGLNLPSMGSTGGSAAGGLIPGPNWLNDPSDAVIRAMRMAGYNPASFNPFSRAVISNSQNLVNTLLNKSVDQGYNMGMADITNNDAMLNSLSQLIKQAGQGRGVLGGGGVQDIARINAAAHQADAPGAGTLLPSQNVLAEHLSDPNKALSLASSVMFGGMHPSFQTAAKAPFINLADYYQRLMETQPTDPRNILDVLGGVAQDPGRSPTWFNTSMWR